MPCKPIKNTKLWHLLEQWANADGDANEDYNKRITCKPNCDSSIGGPPITTITYCVLYITLFYAADWRPTHEKWHKNASLEYGLDFDPCNKTQTGFPEDSCSGIITLADVNSTQMTVENYAATHPNQFMFIASRRSEIWRYITYQFMHQDDLHLWINTGITLLNGTPLELVHDGYLVFGCQTAGVIVGCMLQYWVSTGFLIGASAGVYTIKFMHISNLLLNAEHLTATKIFYTICLNLPSIGIVIFDLVMAFTSTNNEKAYAARLGGMFTALTLGVFMLRNFHIMKWEKSIRRWCFITWCVAFAVLFFVQFKSFGWDSSFSPAAAK